METPQPLNKTVFIFANGDANDGPLVRQALSTYPDATVIAADGGARQAIYYGKVIDEVIGDMDSLDDDEIAALEAAGATLLRHPVEKDETDLELALLRAAKMSANKIRLFAALGDRLDQTLSNIYLLGLNALQGRDVRIVAGKQEAWLAYPGMIVVSGHAGDTLSLIPVNGAAEGIRTENLYYPLKNETLRFGPARGISNVLTSSEARVWLEAGLLLVVHTLGRA